MNSLTWKSRSLICLTLLMLGSMGLPQPVFSQAPPTRISVQPASSRLPACQESHLIIMIHDVTGLVGYSLNLSFPPGSLEVLQVTDGGFLESGFYEPSNGFDNSTGTISFGMVQVNPALPKDGSGNLIDIYFRGATPAVTIPILIDPDSSALVGADYLPIPFIVENGSLATYSCQTFLPTILSPTGRERK